MYSNPMTSGDVLVEYGVQTNTQYSCSDSGKRDRFSWLGDRINSVRAVTLGTHQSEFVWGPAEEGFLQTECVGPGTDQHAVQPAGCRGDCDSDDECRSVVGGLQLRFHTGHL